MTLSARSISQVFRSTFALAVLVAILVPAIASAAELEDGTVDEEVSAIIRTDLDVALVNAEPTSCALSDSSKGDHHPKKSWAEQAEEWEDAAGTHEKAGNHKQAGDSYGQAGCNWERAGELEKAADAYDKAAEQYKKAGEDDLAAAASKKAREIRNSMK